MKIKINFIKDTYLTYRLKLQRKKKKEVLVLMSH